MNVSSADENLGGGDDPEPIFSAARTETDMPVR
jgi:hypothetical protein